MGVSHRAAATAAPAAGSAARVRVDGLEVAVFNRDGHLYGIDARCTHVGCPLEKGTVAGSTVTCPCHGSQFDIATGQVVRGPAARPVAHYAVRSEGNDLIIESLG